ncbi:MAG: DUF99 family protein [Halobacteriota archaeon]|nr:DUF99 family protein [Halobacteriota archaeon]
MTVNVYKKGIRVLGIAESFKRELPNSVLSGVVMRGDFHIDGISLTPVTVGGMDATDGVLKLFRNLKRDDVNALFLNGCVISWFNIVDLKALFDELNLPILCVTYEESEGLEEDIKKHFEDPEGRLEIYKRLGERIPIKLQTGYDIFLRFYGLTEDEAGVLLNRFTTHGKIPEPLRTAKLFARTVLSSKLDLDK